MLSENQLATRTRHPPDDPESEGQPGSPPAWSPAVSVSWWWSPLEPATRLTTRSQRVSRGPLQPGALR